MASVSTRPNGHRWVTFRAPNGKRQTIRLGLATASQADTFKTRVDRLLVASRLGEVPDPGTVEWLASLADNLHDKLSRCGLCNPRGARTVAELAAWSLAQEQSKPSTKVNLRVVCDSLCRYFGKDRRINAITTEQATGFRNWLLRSGGAKGDGLAPTTVSRMCRRSRQMFERAAEERWIPQNPFRKMRGWVETNPARDQLIPAEHVELVIAEMVDPEMRLLLSLARYAGLRCPSEPLLLQWQWIDWSHATMKVHAPKTEQYQGHETRIVPLSQNVLSRLSDLWERAPEGATLIFSNLAVSHAAIADRLEAACRRAGISMWMKPFINMRASCEHDWLRVHPIDEVAAWMGHSPDTMLRHYNRVFKEQSARHAAAGFREALPSDEALKNRSAKCVRGERQRTSADPGERSQSS